jgi:hypothetical protein
MSLLAAGLIAALLASEAALGQPYTLRRNPEPGQVAYYDRVIRTEGDLRTEKRTEKSSVEIRIPRQEIFAGARQSPASVLMVIYETASQERLLALQQDGKDMFGTVPEEKRVRLRPPVIVLTWLGPRGEPVEQVPPINNPMGAIDRAFWEAACLPEQAVKAGDAWTRDLTLGDTKAKLSAKFTEVRAVKGKSYAVLDMAATFTFPAEWTKRFEVPELTFRNVVPLDGSAPLEFTASMTVVEKFEGGEMKRVQQFSSKLVKEERLDAAQLQKVAADTDRIQRATDLARAGKIEEGMAALDAFLKENPKGRWNEAVQLLLNDFARQRRMTQALPLAELRLVLRQYKNWRDSAESQGNAQELAQLDPVITQLANLNLQTLLEESKNSDPLGRDLAAFGLSFAKDDSALARLGELPRDANPRVRGTATMGLAIRGKPVDKETLMALLNDNDTRVRGGAALLALRTVKPGDAQLADLVPLLVANLKHEHPWPRFNAALALKGLAPKGSVPVAIAVIEACRMETQATLKPAFLEALKDITGVDAKEIGPYEDWVRKQPGGDKLPPAPVKPPAAEKPAEKPPAAKGDKPAEKTPAEEKAKPRG